MIREYRNLSPKTIESYLLTLNEFQIFCAKQEILNVHWLSEKETFKSSIFDFQSYMLSRFDSMTSTIKSV